MTVWYAACIPDSTKCRINTVVSPDDGHIVARNMYRLINILRSIYILRKIVHQFGFICKILSGYITL